MDITTKFNGSESTIKGATLKDYFEVIAFLAKINDGKIELKKDFAEVDGHKIKLNNHQYEAHNSYQPIKSDFNLVRALALPCMLYSYETDNFIRKEHTRFKARMQVLEFFISTNNVPSKVEDIARFVVFKVKTTKTSVSIYVTEMVRLGIIAKDEERRTYHISKWFLSQL